jgi:hypothetical protein
LSIAAFFTAIVASAFLIEASEISISAACSALIAAAVIHLLLRCSSA